MSNTPHQLHEDFPEFADKITDLKSNDTHFSRLMDEYGEVNDRVHLAETDVRPMEDLALVELRKQRMTLKDELYHLLTAE